jgi:hypothetical protein
MSRNQRDLEDNSDVELLHNSTLSVQGNSTDVDRDLATNYPGYCANNCAQYVSGRCMALNSKDTGTVVLRPTPNFHRYGQNVISFIPPVVTIKKSEMNNLLTSKAKLVHVARHC